MSTETTAVKEQLQAKAKQKEAETGQRGTESQAAKVETPTAAEIHAAKLFSLCIARNKFTLGEDAQGRPCIKIDEKSLKEARFILPLFKELNAQKTTGEVLSAGEKVARAKTRPGTVEGEVIFQLEGKALDDKENESLPEKESIKAITQIKREILKLLNLTYAKKDFLAANRGNTDFVLKVFFPNLYRGMGDKYRLHERWLERLIKNLNDSIIGSIDMLNKMLGMIGDKSVSEEELVDSFYDTVIETRNGAKIFMEKDLKDILDRGRPESLDVQAIRQDCAPHWRSIIEITEKILPLMENVVSDKLKTYWRFTDSVESTIPSEPFGRHVKLSEYSMELANYYKELEGKRNFHRMFSTNEPERLRILDKAEEEFAAVVENFNAFNKARMQKILSKKAGPQATKAANFRGLSNRVMDREDTRKTFYRVFDFFEQLKTLYNELLLQLENTEHAPQKPIVAKVSEQQVQRGAAAESSAPLEARPSQVQAEKVAAQTAVATATATATTTVTVTVTPTATAKTKTAELDQKQSIEDYRRKQQEALDRFRAQSAEARQKKLEARKKLGNEIKSENKVDADELKLLRTKISKLKEGELDVMLDILENRREFDSDLFEKVVKNLGFEPKDTNDGIKYKFGKYSFSYHKVHASQQKSGKTEIPKDTRLQLRTILWNLGITKEYVHFVLQRMIRKRASIDRGVSVSAQRFI